MKIRHSFVGGSEKRMAVRVAAAAVSATMILGGVGLTAPAASAAEMPCKPGV